MIKKTVLCEILRVSQIQLTTQKINHVDKIIMALHLVQIQLKILSDCLLSEPRFWITPIPENQVIAFLLNAMDGIYANQATPNYIKRITQNWNNEPFIKGGYMTDYADWRTVMELGKSISSKLYFVGGAYTDGEEWVSVHTADKSAKNAIKEINN